MRQQNLFAKAVDKTRCRENNNGGVSLRDQKFFRNAVDKLGFGEKYIRDFEKSKERAKCLLMSKCVKIIDNN